jgi:hypothetical protein
MTEEKILTKHPSGKSGKNINKQSCETLKEAILLALRNKELTHFKIILTMGEYPVSVTGYRPAGMWRLVARTGARF